MPTVSIMMPFLNREATLSRAIQSALAQTFQDWELVAVDDGSTDRSVEVMQSFGDPRIRVVKHERNLGVAAARNTAIQASTAEFIALLDSDDEWLPNKLERQIGAMRTDEKKRAFCSCAFAFERDGTVEHWPRPWGDSWERALHFECTFGFGSTLIVRRDVAVANGTFDTELPRHEDWDWVLRACERGEELLHIDEALVRVISSGLPAVKRMVPSMHRFLEKHDAGIRKYGAVHRRKVFAHHYESIASMAYIQREYLLGSRYLMASYLLWPLRSPFPLAALPLAVVDAAFGTRLIQRGADWRRSWSQNEQQPIHSSAS
jgi:glycosyltransferase involved in cell wall biosynthesis